MILFVRWSPLHVMKENSPFSLHTLQNGNRNQRVNVHREELQAEGNNCSLCDMGRTTCDPEQENKDKQSCHGVTCPLHSEPVVKSDPGPFAICSPVNRIDQTYPPNLGGFLGQNKASSQTTQLLSNSVPEALRLGYASWKPSISLRGFRILT